MKTFTRLLSLISLIVPLAAHALTLEEATRSSAENSHELKQIRLSTESADWSRRKAFAGFLPKLELTGRHLFQEQFEVLEIEFGGSTFAMPAIQPYSSLGLTASWEIFGGFDSTNQFRAATLAREAGEHRLKHAEEKNRVAVRSLFFRALGSQILVEVAEQNIATLEGHLKDINSRVRSGVSTKYDGLRAEVQLEEARTDKVAAESNVAVARARLFEAVGRADDGLPLIGKLPDDFRIAVEKIKVQDATREDRLAQVRTVEAQERSAAAAKAHWMPKVSVFGNEEWYNNSNHYISEDGERFGNAYMLGVQLRWNLFDGGASLASQRLAEIEKQIANEKLAQFDQAAPVDLEESKRRLNYNLINFRAKLGSIRKAEEAVRLARGGLRAGTRTNTEVLDAVVDLNRAKAASIKSQVEAIEALGQLELTVGHSLSN